MGLGSFFKRAWDGAKKAGLYVAGKARQGINYIGKAAKPVMNIAHKTLGLAEHIPGFIGDTAKLINKGIDYGKSLIESLPDSRIKSKLKEYSDQGSDIVKRGVDYAQSQGNVVTSFAQQAKPWLNAGNRLL